jgi:hypothetical protein
MTYWSNEGTYQAEAEVLNELVPGSGEAKTLKGEIWRAATKIYYDYFNNGFGNFWMAPAGFLIARVELSPTVEGILYEYANGNICRGNIQAQMDEMIDTVIVALRGIEDVSYGFDMWDFEAPEYIQNRFAEEAAEEGYGYEDEGYEHAD